MVKGLGPRARADLMDLGLKLGTLTVTLLCVTLARHVWMASCPPQGDQMFSSFVPRDLGKQRAGEHCPLAGHCPGAFTSPVGGRRRSCLGLTG